MQSLHWKRRLKMNNPRKYNAIFVWSTISIICIIMFIFGALILLKEHRFIIGEIQLVENKLKNTQNVIQNENRDSFITKKVLMAKEIPMVISEITQAAQLSHVDLISMIPKKIQKIEDTHYGRMPIEIVIESNYKNSGLFLGELKRLEESIVIVEKFNIWRDKDILPLVKSKLMLEILLQL